MSKVPTRNVWDARESLHRATMAVYSHLGALVKILKSQPNLSVALLDLDEHATPGSAPDGDREIVDDLKHAASRLRSSLATVQKIRKTFGRAACIHGNGGSFGGIGTTSHHEALIDAATEAVEPAAEGAARSGRIARAQSESGLMRRQVIESAMNTKSWARLAENLKDEYRSASLLPPSTIGEPNAPMKDAEHNRVAVKASEWRETARIYFDHATDTSSWSEDEELACTRRLHKASTRLAELLAGEGLEVQPLLTLAALMHSNADEWLDDEDSGHAKRVHAYAAAERLLRRVEVARPVVGHHPATTQVDRDPQGRHDNRAEPTKVPNEIGLAAAHPATSRLEVSSPEPEPEAVRRASASEARAKTMTATPGKSASRPSAAAIDAAAMKTLLTALQASHEAGEPYVPSREGIAKAVGTELKINITVETLFGTKAKGGTREPRYPDFMKLWKQTMQSSNDSRRAKFGRSRRL